MGNARSLNQTSFVGQALGFCMVTFHGTSLGTVQFSNFADGSQGFGRQFAGAKAGLAMHP